MRIKTNHRKAAKKQRKSCVSSGSAPCDAHYAERSSSACDLHIGCRPTSHHHAAVAVAAGKKWLALRTLCLFVAIFTLFVPSHVLAGSSASLHSCLRRGQHNRRDLRTHLLEFLSEFLLLYCTAVMLSSSEHESDGGDETWIHWWCSLQVRFLPATLQRT